MPLSVEVEWLPVPGVLFSRPETSGSVQFHISCLIIEGEPPVGGPVEPVPTITGYAATINKQQSIISLTISAGGVLVSADTLSGLFGIEFVDYQQNRVVTRIYEWKDLPDDADEIVEFRPSSEQSRQYQLTVTADLSNGEQVSASYAMIVSQDWTAGRDRLLREMNVRNNR